MQKGESLKQRIMLKSCLYICRFSIILAYFCEVGGAVLLLVLVVKLGNLSLALRMSHFYF